MTDGVHAIRGYLTPEVAAQFLLIMDALLNPKGDGPPMPGVHFAPSDDADADPSDARADDDSDSGSGSGADADADAEGADPFNSDPRCVIDDRTAAQKRHDALAAVVVIAARHKDMPTLGGASPVLVVNVDAHDLASHAAHAAGSAFGPGATFRSGTAGAGVGVGASGNTGWATIPGSGAHVPVSVAAQVACAGAIQRVLFDEGRIIGITTTDRVFTVHQRRAIIARDKECLIPGCHVPASWCEIHHVTEHAHGGPTHTDNGVPLCWWHHRNLSTSGWEIRMNHGIPQVRGPRWWDPEQRWRTPRLSM
ncbi:HNH endonuclease, partial [Microbacterium sp. ISL-103]|uniref:HNH endonuclease signature motif containing protein n=1 Tax=Microbacterium sp. ISL-103 TaxID=2819156 RepID=UPI001BE53E16